ncbi:MAG TPA: TadE family protein [Candidatus Bathyarchaeia archaeon]|nr:TadE family protein [Candidatus Bathyarchaeia archaeon]
MAGMIGKYNRRDNGQTLLEFALMAPFLLLLLTGVAELGRAIFYTVEVNNAATAGVQYGAQSQITAQNYAQMQIHAADDAPFSGISASALNGCRCDPGNGTSCTYPIVAGTCTNFTCPAGQQVVECVQVTTQATITPLFHFPGLPTSYQANGAAVMRVRR